MPNKEMLVNYVQGEECRIAIIEDGRLEELYQERAASEMHVGNIYKGRVINVEPSIQAAFIDFGLERNGFLHISDLHPKYFPGEDREETEQVGLKTPRRDRPPIQRCLRRGQEILVQVLKEGIGTKGPTLTSYLSIPGRFLVMMPDMERMGVSRKVDDDDARRKMRAILDKLKPPKGFGFIIRTAGIGRTELDLKRDLAYLVRLWKTLEKRRAVTDIGELFAESDLIIRTMRDVYSADITRVIIDDASAAQRARDFLSISNPRSGSNVLVYKDSIPIFHRYGIEEQIEHVNSRTVPLPSGGSLVIDTTEALVAIDVNSGKHRENRDADMTAYKVNMEAVDEICRQLRLRDLGGVIVNDLIDMRDMKHRRDVENRFRDNLKHDRARTRTSPISQFGVLEMTRQRMRPSLTKSLYHDCPACQGTGMSRSAESMVLSVIRHLSLVLQRPSISRVEVTVSPDVAFQLLNRKRAQLVQMEQQYGKTVTVRVFSEGGMSYIGIAGFDARGSTVDVQAPFLFSEPILEPVPGLLDDSELGELVDEAFVEETTPDQRAASESQSETAGNETAARFATQGDDNMFDAADTTAADDAGVVDGMELETAANSDEPQHGSDAEDLHAGATSQDDPLAEARAHYHDGEEEVVAPDEHSSRPGFHGPRVVVPAPASPSLISHSTPPPPFRQQQHRAPVGPPRPPQQQNFRPQNPQQGQGQGDGQGQGEGRSGRRRRRRRRGRGGGQGQNPPMQPGQFSNQHQQPGASGAPSSDRGNQPPDPLLEGVAPLLGEVNSNPDFKPENRTMNDVNSQSAASAGNLGNAPQGPTEEELDELVDSIGNLKSPELIELARRRLAGTTGAQQGQQPGGVQGNAEGGEGQGRRRRRRRRGRGGRGGGQQGAGGQQDGNFAGDSPQGGPEPVEALGGDDRDEIETVAQDEPPVEKQSEVVAEAVTPEAPAVSETIAPAEPVKPARTPRKPTVKKAAREPVPDLVSERLTAREPVPDLVAERLAASELLEKLAAVKPKSAVKPAPVPPPVPAAVTATPASVEAPAAPKLEVVAPSAPVKPAPTPRAPKRPLPAAVPLFAPPEEAAAPAPVTAPISVDPVNPVKSRSPIVRPPYRRKKAPAPESPKPE